MIDTPIKNQRDIIYAINELFRTNRITKFAVLDIREKEILSIQRKIKPLLDSKNDALVIALQIPRKNN